MLRKSQAEMSACRMAILTEFFMVLLSPFREVLG